MKTPIAVIALVLALSSPALADFYGELTTFTDPEAQPFPVDCKVVVMVAIGDLAKRKTLEDEVSAQLGERLQLTVHPWYSLFPLTRQVTQEESVRLAKEKGYSAILELAFMGGKVNASIDEYTGEQVNFRCLLIDMMHGINPWTAVTKTSVGDAGSTQKLAQKLGHDIAKSLVEVGLVEKRKKR